MDVSTCISLELLPMDINLLTLGITPKRTLADAKLAPCFRVNPVDICIEVVSHIILLSVAEEFQ